MRESRLVLYRIGLPFRKTVRLRRITVGGFLELVRSIAPRVAAVMIDSKQPLTDEALIRASASADTMSVAADLLCVDQPIGFLKSWLHGRCHGAFAKRNTEALLRACRQVEGEGQWTRFLSCLNRPGAAGKKSGKGGGLMADVLLVARMFSVTPEAILSGPLKDFLDLCDAMNLQADIEERSDPTADPDAEPSPVSAFPGFEVIH